MRIEDRDEFVDLVAQAVIDRIEERDRIAGLVELVVSKVLALQKEQATAPPAPDNTPPRQSSRSLIPIFLSRQENTQMSESKKSAEQVEQERLTRRQALRKLGFGAGLSAIMLLGADDLARIVGARMRQMGLDNRVAEQVAREFQGMGVAFASGPSWAGCDTCTTSCKPGPYQYCESCIWPCTGSILRNQSCGDFQTRDDCNACCSYRNPMDAAGYAVCTTAGGCDNKPRKTPSGPTSP